MSRIPARHTTPELAVRRALRNLKERFQAQARSLPGTPDFVLPMRKLALFVHGCFWHQHSGCKRNFTPKSNRAYWVPKLAGNVVRFKKVRREIRKIGWGSAVIWECEAKDRTKLMKKVGKISNPRG